MTVAIELLEPHPLALRCAGWSAGEGREAAERALDASVRAEGVRTPLAAFHVPRSQFPVPSGADGAEPARRWWVVDGCSRLEAARAANLRELPVEELPPMDDAAVAAEVFRRNTLRKPYSSSQRTMLWIDLHLGEILMAYTGKAGRPKKNASREAIFTVDGTADALGVSRDDISAGVELARCVNGRLVPCETPDGRTLREATDEEAVRIVMVYDMVRRGRTPLRKWLAAFAGLAQPGGGRDEQGRPKVNWETFGRRAATSLRTLFSGWREMKPQIRAKTLDDLSEAIDGAPEDVIELLRGKLAQRDAMEGGAE